MNESVKAQQKEITEAGDEARKGLTLKQEEVITQMQARADLVNTEFDKFQRKLSKLKACRTRNTDRPDRGPK